MRKARLSAEAWEENFLLIFVLIKESSYRVAAVALYSDLLEDVRCIFIPDSSRTSKDSCCWLAPLVRLLRDLQGDVWASDCGS